MADIQVGDMVKFLDEVGGGTVTKIIDHNTALIQTDDGFEFPYPINKLIVIKTNRTENNQPNEKSEYLQDKNPFETDQPDIIKDNDQTNIYLAIVPKNHFKLSHTEFDIYLVNDSNWHLIYIYQIPDRDKVKSYPAYIQPNMIDGLMTLNPKELKQIEEITFQIIFWRKTTHIPRKPLIAKIKLKTERIFSPDSYMDNDYFENNALLYPILEEHPLDEAIKKLQQHDFHKVKDEKERINQQLNKPKQFRSGKKPDLWEIDLHITELLDDTRNMTPKDMLEYQMQVFKDKLEQGLRDPNVKKIVFIHGRGNGTLRQQIRSYLDRKKIPYQDASFAKYGFGATLVFVG